MAAPRHKVRRVADDDGTFPPAERLCTRIGWSTRSIVPTVIAVTSHLRHVCRTWNPRRVPLQPYWKPAQRADNRRGQPRGNVGELRPQQLLGRRTHGRVLRNVGRDEDVKPVYLALEVPLALLRDDNRTTRGCRPHFAGTTARAERARNRHERSDGNVREYRCRRACRGSKHPASLSSRQGDNPACRNRPFWIASATGNRRLRSCSDRRAVESRAGLL